MNIAALFKVAFDAAQIEASGQLTADGITLYQYYSKFKGGYQISQLTEADLNAMIPALSRTIFVIGQLWHDETKHADILAAVKGL